MKRHIKANEKKNNRSGLNKAFMKKNHGLFAGALAFHTAMAILTLYVSIGLQKAIDIITYDGNLHDILAVAVEMTAVILGILISGYGYGAVRSRFVAKAMTQYKNTVVDNVMEKGIAAFREESPSAYISGLTNDCNVIEENLVGAKFDIIYDILSFSGALIIMLIYSPLLTFVAIGFTLLPVMVSAFSGRKISVYESRVAEKNQSYVALIQEAFGGFSVIKSFKAESDIVKMIGENTTALEDDKAKRNIIRNLLVILGVSAGAITQFGVFLVGGILSINGMGFTPGILMMFLNLLNFVVGPISRLPGRIANHKAASVLVRKMDEALRISASVAGSGNPCRADHSIEIRDLNYEYENGKKVLDDFNYTFETGKSYAIVGASGCGKSTLLQLLQAGMSDYDGRIMYDKDELHTIDKDRIYDTISVIQQNVFVFNASIRDNITMFASFPENEIRRAIKLSGLEELVNEKGMDYNCGENGNALSGGEKQRISIARALLRKSKVLLVDEATASLDNVNSAQVLNSILDLENVTKLVVTHDLDRNVLKRFDRIVTMKEGSVCESASFEELMAKKGYFYSYYNVA